MTFHWKKAFLSNTTKIFQQNTEIGFLKYNFWGIVSKAEVEQKSYFFRRNFPNNSINILDKNQHQIGEIKFNIWRNGAILRLNHITYHWKPDNWLNTNFSLKGDDKSNIQYSLNNRFAVSNSDNFELILAGLYISKFKITNQALVILIMMLPLFLKNLFI